MGTCRGRTDYVHEKRNSTLARESRDRQLSHERVCHTCVRADLVARKAATGFDLESPLLGNMTLVVDSICIESRCDKTSQVE